MTSRGWWSRLPMAHRSGSRAPKRNRARVRPRASVHRGSTFAALAPSLPASGTSSRGVTSLQTGCDADETRYCSRAFRSATWHAYQYLSRAPAPLPQPGSGEALQAEIERMRQFEEDEMRARLAEQEPPVGLTEWFENRDPLLQ